VSDSKDDPDLLLFTCAHCGHWPMAHQAQRPFTLEAEFACPRCHQHASMRIRQGLRRLQARPPDPAPD
jgi:transcription elongation factor Elf1